ncbi:MULTISPECIES: TlpA disulfide reductase family protein [unclassified Sphingomonas]|uniref:TlpA family protein disulfide reductase n=1 Tax=unclassified Sphingomonas TaxID=196159 RepID=UPI00286349BA|nr:MULTISPECIES: TlpA disulfide reductase family protein [unclassified Sphingomonas]MDR6114086.1 thiol-disulfide isomerase/thioredoxin [Sphingomonas sp. SORGH_AS_0789]MDR6148554.1 thiol-disulfide isomerase/thioredoxin [Sphingomonas sp. SORGH_AS_0742]
MSSRTVIACLLGLMVAGCDKQSPAPEQAANTATGEVSSGEVTAGEVTGGEVASTPEAPKPAGAVNRSHKGEAAPTLGFTTLDGKPTTLADFRGKPVLVNLWATWCGPCVAEMPTLAATAERLKGKVAVIAVAQDEAAKVKPFLAGRKLDALPVYLDPKLGLSVHYQANLPTTILYGADGKEIWRVTGGFDWAGAEAQKLLSEAK